MLQRVCEARKRARDIKLLSHNKNINTRLLGISLREENQKGRIKKIKKRGKKID